MTETIRLFVYGTLSRGGIASGLLKGGVREGEASIRGTLYDVGGRFPALVIEGQGLVHGELWNCPAKRLVELDRYEGVPDGLFRRVSIEVGGRPCWVYVAGPWLRAQLEDAAVLPDGVWPPRER